MIIVAIGLEPSVVADEGRRRIGKRKKRKNKRKDEGEGRKGVKLPLCPYFFGLLQLHVDADGACPPPP